MPQGIAGRLSARLELGEDISQFITMGATISIEINNLPFAVYETFRVGNEDKILDLQAGPYVRITAYDTVVGISGYNFSGDFFFDQATNPGPDGDIETTTDNVKVTRLAVANIEVTIGGEGLRNGMGALIIMNSGVAGIVSGEASLAAGGFEIGGTLGLRINTTGGAVDETIDVNGTKIIVRFSETETGFSFFASDLKIVIANFISIEGSVVFSGDSFAGEGIEIFMGSGPYRLENGEVNDDAIGVLLTNGQVGMVKFDGGKYALHAEGEIALVGLDDWLVWMGSRSVAVP